MNYDTYHWNLTLAVCGILAAISALMNLHKKEWPFLPSTLLFIQSGVWGMIGAWNLICLLVKLNVIHP